MILPDNGKVIIFDDKIDQVKDLMSALSTEKIPFLHYQNTDGSDLPSTPIDNVRLIFLDLMLVSDDENASPANVVSAIAVRLKAVLNKNNGPYVLIYWSTRERDFKKHLVKAFKNRLKDYAPFIAFSMDKTAPIADIKTELDRKFKKFKSLNAFLLFESIVNKSGGDIFNEFTQINPKNNSWNKNLKNIIYSLAHGLAGKSVDSLSNNKKLKAAYNNISTTLIDTLEVNISENYGRIDLRDIEKGTLSEGTLAKINSKLHSIKNDTGFRDFHTGNLYTVANNAHDIERIIRDNVDGPAKITEVINSNPSLVELDVTPNCDYAQNKFGYIRLLPGLLVNASFKTKYFKTGKDSLYLLCPPMKINNQNLYLVFDYRFLKSMPTADLTRRTPKATFRLRNDILVDIQTGLAKHINRPGIITIS